MDRVPQPQIFAFSGMLVTANDSRTNSDLTAHALSLTGKASAIRACYLPTAVGDSPVEQRVTARSLF